MESPFPRCERHENQTWLLAEFKQLLFRQEPSSVLDIGCGSGSLLRACREKGVEAVGLEQPGPALEAAQEEGHEVAEGSANKLPFLDRSHDWVVLRHVPHHLDDIEGALAEAVRVSRTGLILAEPSFDVTLPCQRGALAVDHWEKAEHRRAGMFHAAVLDIPALLAALPAGHEQDFLPEVHDSLRLRGRSVQDFEAEAAALVAELPPESPGRAALATLLTELRATGLSWTGSRCLVLRRI